MRSLTLAASLAAAVLAGASPADAMTNRDWKHTWAVGGAPTVRVVTDDARVRIHRGGPGSVSARVHYECRAWGLSSGGREPKVVFAHENDVIRIEAREPHAWVMFGGLETKFTIDVTVPANCDLSARSGDGAITCDPLEGRISLESGDGRIRAAGLRGTLVLWSGDGGIDADSLDGSLMARTGDGHLKLAGRFDHLDARTGDGRMEVTAARGSQASGPWSVESGDGAILLRIPRDLRVLLDASSRDGSLRVDLPITTQGRIRNNTLVGELNGGNVPLRLRSGDGSITLALSE
jgi:hypothetical protein